MLMFQVGVIGVVGLVGTGWLLSKMFGGKSAIAHSSDKELKFPEPIRDWEKEKEEFIKLFMEVEDTKKH